MSILRPIFGRGVAQRRLGAEVPEFRQKFPVLLGAPVVPKARIWNSKKMCLGPPLSGENFELLRQSDFIESLKPWFTIDVRGKHGFNDTLYLCSNLLNPTSPQPPPDSFQNGVWKG